MVPTTSAAACRRELQPAELRADKCLRKGLERQGLGQPRHTFKQQMPIGQQAHDQTVDEVSLPDDDPCHLRLQRRHPPGGVLNLLLDLLHVSVPSTPPWNGVVRIAIGWTGVARYRIDCSFHVVFSLFVLTVEPNYGHATHARILRDHYSGERSLSLTLRNRPASTAPPSSPEGIAPATPVWTGAGGLQGGHGVTRERGVGSAVQEVDIVRQDLHGLVQTMSSSAERLVAARSGAFGAEEGSLTRAGAALLVAAMGGGRPGEETFLSVIS